MKYGRAAQKKIKFIEIVSGDCTIPSLYLAQMHIVLGISLESANGAFGPISLHSII